MKTAKRQTVIQPRHLTKRWKGIPRKNLKWHKHRMLALGLLYATLSVAVATDITKPSDPKTTCTSSGGQENEDFEEIPRFKSAQPPLALNLPQGANTKQKVQRLPANPGFEDIDGCYWYIKASDDTAVTAPSLVKETPLGDLEISLDGVIVDPGSKAFFPSLRSNVNKTLYLSRVDGQTVVGVRLKKVKKGEHIYKYEAVSSIKFKDTKTQEEAYEMIKPRLPSSCYGAKPCDPGPDDEFYIDWINESRLIKFPEGKYTFCRNRDNIILDMKSIAYKKTVTRGWQPYELQDFKQLLKKTHSESLKEKGIRIEKFKYDFDEHNVIVGIWGYPFCETEGFLLWSIEHGDIFVCGKGYRFIYDPSLMKDKKDYTKRMMTLNRYGQKVVTKYKYDKNGNWIGAGRRSVPIDQYYNDTHNKYDKKPESRNVSKPQAPSTFRFAERTQITTEGYGSDKESTTGKTRRRLMRLARSERQQSA